MADEMLSGPDLGGGYLHQLTVDTMARPPRFTFHAQVGGADASGPPLGPLDAFGFVHPPLPCSFGGPRCWHRTFDTEVEQTANVRQAYNRFRFVLATLLEQRHAGRPVAVEAALVEVVTRLTDPDPAPERRWYIGGSTAAWLQGAKIAPRDIDLGNAATAVAWIAAALKDYLIEPLAQSTWGTDRRIYGARAFVGTMHEGARVEWGAPALDRPSAGRWEEWTLGADGVRTRSVEYRGRSLEVSRPEYAFVRALEKGAEANARAIRETIRSLGADGELLRELLSRSTLSDAQRAAALAEFPG